MFSFRSAVEKNFRERLALKTVAQSRAQRVAQLAQLAPLEVRNYLMDDLSKQIQELKSALERTSLQIQPQGFNPTSERVISILSDAVVARVGSRLLPELFDRLAQPLEERLSNYIQRHGVFNLERSSRKLAKELAMQLAEHLETTPGGLQGLLPHGGAARQEEAAERRAPQPVEKPSKKIPLDDVGAIIDFLIQRND